MINITAIGDSIIDAVGRGGVTEQTQWPVLLLTERLGQTIITMEPFSPWTGGDKGPNNKIVTQDYTFYNAGIGSETSVSMLSRFDQDVLGHPTDIVIILGGVNDLSYNFGMDSIQKNLIGMYDKADDARLDVIVATLLPWNNATPAQHNQVDTLNTWIRETAINRRYGLVDWYTILENPVGSQHMNYYGGEVITGPDGTTFTVTGSYPDGRGLSTDGVHVNVLGQRVMAATFDLSQLTYVSYDLYSYAVVSPPWRDPLRNYQIDAKILSHSTAFSFVDNHTEATFYNDPPIVVHTKQTDKSAVIFTKEVPSEFQCANY